MRRVLVGPSNAAGQAVSWVRALRAAGIEADSMSFRPLGRQVTMKTPTDIRLPPPRLTTRSGRVRRGHRLIKGYSHVALDGFAPMLQSVGANLSVPELDLITSWGARVALVAHGSDVREPERYLRDNPGSYFELLPADEREWLSAWSAHNRSVAVASALPLFVSTRDLLLDLPGATWLPVTVDVGRWRAAPRQRRSRPRVLHVPSSTKKGSDVIDPALEALDRVGHIEYLRPRAVPQAEMPRLVASADVVVDQVRSDFYGVSAVEAMVSGAVVVVGSLSTRVRENFPGEPAIVESTPTTVRSTMERLLDERDDWPQRVERGQAYADEWHDGRASARALLSFVMS